MDGKWFMHSMLASWLNQLEQCRNTWGDSDQMLHMHRALVWHVAMATQAASASSSAGAGEKAAIKLRNYNALAKPGTKS